MKRRDFVKIGGLGTTALIIDGCKAKGNSEKKEILPLTHLNQIKVISTWNSGINANKAAIEALKNNKSALDAVELGLNVIESDPENTSVGIGGLPDENGLFEKYIYTKLILNKEIQPEEFNRDYKDYNF